jgi:hypothetical protein
MAPVSRRSFLAGLIAAPVLAAGVVRTAPKQVATIASGLAPDETLTGRILRSLKRRKELGQVNGAIVVSDAGFARIEREHGLEQSHLDISLRGVPVFRRPELTADDDYWVVSSAHGLHS